MNIATTKRATHRPATGLRYARSSSDAVVAGVAGGLGARWGVEPLVVRIAFVVLAWAGAVGVFAYLVAWAVAQPPGHSDAPPARPPSAQQAVSLGLIVIGAVLLLREAGIWLGDAIGVPLLLAAAGTGVIYVRADERERPRWTRPGGARELALGQPSLVRIVVGGLLVVGGVGSFLAAQRSLAAIGSVLVAVVVTSSGLALVFGPWVLQLAKSLTDERRDRIRSEERAEMAAHLHDSVLQTLALIQRNAGHPRKMTSLARRQERELRSWLYGSAGAHESDTLAAAVQTMAETVEESHDVAVEVVVVGDCATDDRMRALVHACREAVTNAALHSGTGEVSVYVECEDGEISAYVRDRGRGFVPDEVPPGRRGIRDSIRARLQRHGGSVAIASAPGEGTEVHLRMPR